MERRLQCTEGLGGTIITRTLLQQEKNKYHLTTDSFFAAVSITHKNSGKKNSDRTTDKRLDAHGPFQYRLLKAPLLEIV